MKLLLNRPIRRIILFSAMIGQCRNTKLLLFEIVLVLRIIMVDLHMTVAPDQNAITIYCFHALDNEHQYDEPMSSLYI